MPSTDIYGTAPLPYLCDRCEVHKIDDRVAPLRELTFLRQSRCENQHLQGSVIVAMMKETPKMMGVKKEDLRPL